MILAIIIKSYTVVGMTFLLVDLGQQVLVVSLSAAASFMGCQFDQSWSQLVNGEK